MPTVGIMSMQRIYNYGSSLQAYALRRLVERALTGARVTFVDYEPGPTLVKPESNRSETSRVARVASKLREYNSVDSSLRDKLRFFNHKRSYAAKYFPLVGIPQEKNRDLDLDLQLVGSDEVFNCVQDNTNVGYSRDLFGHGSPARQIASYAGSFGNTTIEKIDAAGIRQELSDDLSRFLDVSVRDRNSQQIVEELTGRIPKIHLDPTLVYDFPSSESRIPSDRQYPGKYMIVYGYAGRIGNEENKAIRRYANRIGARVLAFGGIQAAADEFIDCDPFTLLAYFRDAAAVVTDTFHGTIFSVINEVPFATIIRRSFGQGYGNEEKLGFLLEVLRLSEQALHSPSDLERLLDDPIDFSKVRDIRERERSRTADYLADLHVQSEIGGEVEGQRK